MRRTRETRLARRFFPLNRITIRPGVKKNKFSPDNHEYTKARRGFLNEIKLNVHRLCERFPFEFNVVLVE